MTESTEDHVAQAMGRHEERKNQREAVIRDLQRVIELRSSEIIPGDYGPEAVFARALIMLLEGR